MSVFERVRGQIGEMFVWFDHQGVNLYNIIHVSPSTYSSVLKDINTSTRYVESGERSIGIQRIMMQTDHANFFLDSDKSVKDDDIEMKDVNGYRYSYQEHYLNQVAEKILLTGDSNV